ncbi:hypothetical protein [Nocardioides pantholopis]|uniref:hypothetical protein n=1 Tax=Nocardioides pantholopis TaxID=2483798 RepID=UPI000FDA74CD|nr:hypothetical protein [Nocardioides pantholopis]
MNEHHTDPGEDRLRDRLRAADPASSLPPAGPERTARLLEATMTDDVDRLARSRAAAPTEGARGRGPLTWLVAGAAVVVIAGAAVFTVTAADDDEPELPSAQETLRAPSGRADVTELSAAAAPGRCAVPTPAALARQELAFEGTVQGVDEDVVVLAPTTFFAGPETDLVEVQAPAAQLDLLLDTVPFQVGRSYLVAASGGRVSLCGLTGPATPDLERLYDDAFAR